MPHSAIAPGPRGEPQSLAAKYQETGGVTGYKLLMNAGLIAIDYQNRGV